MPEPVYDGDHEDHAWRAAAAKKPGKRSRSEQLLVDKGPRRHPFPEGKVHVEEVVLPDGQARVRYFADAGEAERFRGQEKGVRVQRTLSQPGRDNDTRGPAREGREAVQRTSDRTSERGPPVPPPQPDAKRPLEPFEPPADERSPVQASVEHQNVRNEEERYNRDQRKQTG